MNLQKLEALGFDRSRTAMGFGAVECSQCEALVINNTPCHEAGCPNERHELECKWCGATFIQTSRHDTTCSHPCHVSYTNDHCDCDECSPFDDDEDIL